MTHTQHWHQKQKTVGSGHLYQGRYKSFLIQKDQHLQSVIRYIERNPVRVKIIKKAENWEFGSLAIRLKNNSKIKMLAEWPIEMPNNYLDFVNKPLTSICI